MIDAGSAGHPLCRASRCTLEATLTAEAQSYLARLDIAHKVAIRDGAFTTTDLSTGQRKRLALVHAYPERRPVMVLDEWAADRDPTFRRIFYTEILPDLKRQGKTLIVISHDDRYFSAADRYIRLENGRVVEEVRPDRLSAISNSQIRNPNYKNLLKFELLSPLNNNDAYPWALAQVHHPILGETAHPSLPVG